MDCGAEGCDCGAGDGLGVPFSGGGESDAVYAVVEGFLLLIVCPGGWCGIDATAFAPSSSSCSSSSYFTFPVFETALSDETTGKVVGVGTDCGEDGVEAGHVEGVGAVPVLGPVWEGGDLAVGEVEVVGVYDG